MSIITAGQVRAARAFLKWSREDLATSAGLSLQMIKDYEETKFPTTIGRTTAIQKALEKAGIQFGWAGRRVLISAPTGIRTVLRKPRSKTAKQSPRQPRPLTLHLANVMGKETHSLKTIYKSIEDLYSSRGEIPPKSLHAQIRRTLQSHAVFKRQGRGLWSSVGKLA